MQSYVRAYPVVASVEAETDMGAQQPPAKSKRP